MSRLLLTLLAACALHGCATPSTEAAVQDKAQPASFSLGPGDKLRINVFGEEKLSGEYSVTNNGYISFPLIGNVAVKGHTLEEVQESMRSELAAGYLQDPRVSIEIVDYRPYYILGEVTKPGEYPYVAGLTLEQAIATAGGYTYRAKRSRIFIKRATQPSEQSVAYQDQIVIVQPGDTIRVPERFF